MYLGRPAMAKKIIFIHGRAQKPDKDSLQALWYEAIEHGLERDCGTQVHYKLLKMSINGLSITVNYQTHC
ncbi:hypothetical protein VCR4J2_570015 [Vibrio coralliirubri]|nr:hypothetical protein VCR4J2_570015 [Vibrio coralliirubri]